MTITAEEKDLLENYNSKLKKIIAKKESKNADLKTTGPRRQRSMFKKLMIGSNINNVIVDTFSESQMSGDE